MGRWIHRLDGALPMFFFFSNKLGVVGSILVSIILSLLLIGLFFLF
jgi:hypothetical protein